MKDTHVHQHVNQHVCPGEPLLSWCLPCAGIPTLLLVLPFPMAGIAFPLSPMGKQGEDGEGEETSCYHLWHLQQLLLARM